MKNRSRRLFIENLTLGIAAGGASPFAAMAQKPANAGAQRPIATQAEPPEEPVVPFNARPGYDVLYCLECGNDFAGTTPGFQPLSRVYRSPRYLWISDVRDAMRAGQPVRLFRSFAEGADGELWVGLDDGDYDVTLIMADAEEAHGPFAIFLQDQLAAPGVSTSPGKILTQSFPLRVSQGKFRLRFHAETGKTFVLNRLIIQGPPGKAARSIFPQAPPRRPAHRGRSVARRRHRCTRDVARLL